MLASIPASGPALKQRLAALLCRLSACRNVIDRITAAVISRIDVPARGRRGRNERCLDEIDEAMPA